MAAGGAATSVPVLNFFEDIGVPIMEGYGLTETSPMISSSTFCFAFYFLFRCFCSLFYPQTLLFGP
jgi:long-subunit acyl-CoA synthetase (AMP-forming)